MALDLYAGPLTRYFCGDWENIVARLSREQGRPYKIIRPPEDPDPKANDPKMVELCVREWAAALSKWLGTHLSSPIGWRDDATLSYDTDRPHWPGYGALVLTAAHADRPQHPLPAVAPDRWNDHPAFVEASAEGTRSRFTQILLPELWLPAAFQFTVKAPGPSGEQAIWLGSVPSLVSQLDLLNDLIFQASAEDLAQWRRDGLPPDNALPAAARFGFAVFHHLAVFARDHQLPLKLDY